MFYQVIIYGLLPNLAIKSFHLDVLLLHHPLLLRTRMNPGRQQFVY